MPIILILLSGLFQQSLAVSITSESCGQPEYSNFQMSDSGEMGSHNIAECQTDHFSCELNCTTSGCTSVVLHEKRVSVPYQIFTSNISLYVTSISTDGFATIIYHPPITTS